jgi:hypothetical protein
VKQEIVKIEAEIRHRWNGFHRHALDLAIKVELKFDVGIRTQTSVSPAHDEGIMPEMFHFAFEAVGSVELQHQPAFILANRRLTPADIRKSALKSVQGTLPRRNYTAGYPGLHRAADDQHGRVQQTQEEGRAADTADGTDQTFGALWLSHRGRATGYRQSVQPT